MDDKYEYRTFYQGQLMCQNPRQYYQMTRSYESMRQEWEMLNPDKVYDNHIAMFQLAYLNRRKKFYEKDIFITMLPFIPVWIVLGYLYYLMIGEMFR